MSGNDGANLFLIIWMLFVVVIFVVATLGTIFWVWMIVDCATKESDQGNDKVVWIAIILVTHLIGAIIYYFVRRRPRIAQFGR